MKTNFFLATALAAVISFPAHSMELTPSEQELVDLWTPISDQMKAEGATVGLWVISNPEPNSSPIIMGRSKNLQCVFVIAVRGDNMKFFRRMTEHAGGGERRKAFIQTLIAHEAGHCMQTVTNTLNEATKEKEADVFGVLWTKRFNPQYAEDVRNELTRMRHRFPQEGELYDTWNQIDATEKVDVSNMTVRQLFELAQKIVKETK